jgi:hypothetical protein
LKALDHLRQVLLDAEDDGEVLALMRQLRGEGWHPDGPPKPH